MKVVIISGIIIIILFSVVYAIKKEEFKIPNLPESKYNNIKEKALTLKNNLPELKEKSDDEIKSIINIELLESYNNALDLYTISINHTNYKLLTISR